MLLLTATAIAIIYALLKPLSDGLFDTSMWVAKMLAPSDSAENDATKQFMKVSQAALMDGWLSNIPFITSLLGLSSVVVGFLYSWWGGISMYAVSTILGGLTKVLMTRSVSHYLPYLHHKMVNRAADYKRNNDAVRYEASESFCRDLEAIMAIYHDSRRKPPTRKQLKTIPYGDQYYWCEIATQ